MTRTDRSNARVLAVVVLAGAVGFGGCGAPAHDGAGTAVLSGSESSTASPPASPEIAPEPAIGVTPVGGRPWDAAVSVACGGELGAAFTERAQTRDDVGVTSIWTAGERWVLCDVVETGDGDVAPLLIRSAGLPEGFDERSLAVSTAPLEDGRVRLLAGGRLPWPVEQIAYTFPDGHTERARFVAGEGTAGQTWWVVTHTPSDGPLADPAGPAASAAELGPATISVMGPAAEAFRVPWEELQRAE